jgi:Tfp pilus assembly protein PilX
VRRLLADEQGVALATAVIVIAIMMALGLATATIVDTQANLTERERLKETAFNVGEAVLNAEVLQLSQTWPGTRFSSATGGPYPSSCSRGAANASCPDSTALVAGFQGTGFATSTAWTVTVRDNLAPATTYYERVALDSSVCPAATGTMTPCTWDSNGDGAMWVRAQATVGAESRTVVALVKLDLVAEQFPQNTITAGKFRTSNSGNKVIVDTKGCAAVGAPAGGCVSQRAAPVVVRCAANPPYTRSNTCLGFDQNKGQVSPPDSVQTGFVGRAVPVNAIDDFRRRAKASGTYYASGCPASLAGPVVFIENGNCSYTGGTFNSVAAPGLVVVKTGALSLGGNVTYFGTIYAANENLPPADAGDIVSLGGTATVQGGIVIEGRGGLLAGSSKLNVVYDPGGSANLFGYGTSAEISHNTFRELPADR